MSTWSAVKSSWSSGGVYGMDLPYHDKGPRASYALQVGGARPQVGLLNHMKRGVLDMVGMDNAGVGRVMAGNGTARYGGGLFSGGGIREIARTTMPSGNAATPLALGARRSATGMLGRGLMKAFGPGMFAYQALTEGVGAASKDAVVNGAIFGAAKWGLGKLGMAVTGIPTLAVGAIAGGIIGGRAALQAGRSYNKKLRMASFGNMHQDIYGTAATMRQASLNAIQGSKLNARNSIGFESSLLHQ